MLAVTSPGFVVFAALLAWLWFRCAPARRWQCMLAASAVFYLSLDWQGYLVLLASAVLTWFCALRASAASPRPNQRLAWGWRRRWRRCCC